MCKTFRRKFKPEFNLQVQYPTLTRGGQLRKLGSSLAQGTERGVAYVQHVHAAAPERFRPHDKDSQFV